MFRWITETVLGPNLSRGPGFVDPCSSQSYVFLITYFSTDLILDVNSRVGATTKSHNYNVSVLTLRTSILTR